MRVSTIPSSRGKAALALAACSVLASCGIRVSNGVMTVVRSDRVVSGERQVEVLAKKASIARVAMTEEVALLGAAATERAEDACGGRPVARILEFMSRDSDGNMMGNYAFRCDASR
jgi:hypothetical protein